MIFGQLVGPSGTSSMIPQASNLSNFFSTFSLTPNGILWMGCATSFTGVLSLIFDSYPFKRPTQLNSSLYLSFTSDLWSRPQICSQNGWVQCKVGSVFPLSQQSRVLLPFPSITTKSASTVMLVSVQMTWAVNVLNVGIVVWCSVIIQMRPWHLFGFCTEFSES